MHNGRDNAKGHGKFKIQEKISWDTRSLHIILGVSTYPAMFHLLKCLSLHLNSRTLIF